MRPLACVSFFLYPLAIQYIAPHKAFAGSSCVQCESPCIYESTRGVDGLGTYSARISAVVPSLRPVKSHAPWSPAFESYPSPAQLELVPLVTPSRVLAAAEARHSLRLQVEPDRDSVCAHCGPLTCLTVATSTSSVTSPARHPPSLSKLSKRPLRTISRDLPLQSLALLRRSPRRYLAARSSARTPTRSSPHCRSRSGMPFTCASQCTRRRRRRTREACCRRV